MLFFIIITLVLITGPLSLLLPESDYDERDRQGWWAGARR